MRFVTDWEVVVWCLSPTQAKLEKFITPEESREARMLADGMGKLTPEMMEADPGILWDWSHVRDSSPEAVKAVAEFLRDCL